MGANVKVQGGESLVVPTIIAAGNTKWVNIYSQLDVAAQQQIIAARYPWKVLAGTTNVTNIEKRVSGGREQVIDFVEAKLDIAEIDARQAFNLMIFSDGSDANQPVGLIGIASTSDPSTGPLGGISRSAYPTFQGFVNTATKTLETTDMLSGWVATTYNNQAPDLIVTTQTLFRTYEAIAAGNIRFTNPGDSNVTASMGFETVMYKSANVLWDRDCPAGDVFLVNTDYLHFYNLGGEGFVVEGPVDPYNQLLDVYKVCWYGQLVCTQPRTVGILQNRS